MRFPALMFATLVGLTGLTQAARADDCANASDQATLNECADKALKASDTELNTLYKQIEARLKDDQDKTKLLVSAQKAWIAFRDTECDFSAAGVAGGSVYPMIVLQCRDGLTQNRVKDFKSYLSCEEGDLSCPIPSAN
ncbi:lysozyme inhibitor LprI family protein [Ensifer sp. 4252]|uniref:lysozyme inhibitor LprI family protein n=1 Tax=Ensifer sp. 4252 TaxID=3373915 RepID=UPI003D225C63